MTFGYTDGTEINAECDVMAVCDGDTCYQLVVFDKDTDHQDTYILDYSQEKRDKLFSYVRKRFG